MEKSKGTKTRDMVIDKAIALVHENGFNKTSMKDIIAATGVKKGNLYFHFKNKEQIGLAIIEQARQKYWEYLREHMTSSSPLGNIEQLLTAVLNYHRSRQFIGGCIFGNIALEMGDLNPNFADSIKTVFQQWEEALARLLEKAQNLGEIPSKIDPKSMASHIVASMEGSIMMAKLHKDETCICNCIESIMTILKL